VSFRNLFRLSAQKQATVKDVHISAGSVSLSWNRVLQSREENQLASLLAEVEKHISVTGGSNVKLWNVEKNGAYTVKLATRLIDGICNPRANSFSDLLWKGWMSPPKVDAFLWLMLQGSLSTIGFLAYRHIIHHNDALCPFCVSEIESISHLFLHCYETWRFWTCFTEWLVYQGCMPNSVDTLLWE